MELTSTLTSKGQTTIPIGVRKKLGLRPRQKIRYEIKKGQVILKPAGKSLSEIAGTLSGAEKMRTKEEERTASQESRKKQYTKDA